MANSKQAKKRILIAEKSRVHNAARRSEMRTYLKRTHAAVESKDLIAAQENFSKAVVLLDRYAMKGLIHKNKAARHKSRLSAKIKSIQG